MLTLLIDGDIIAYRAASATEVPIQWEEDLWTLHGIPSEDMRMLMMLLLS